MSVVPQIVKSLSKEVAPALPQFMEQPGLFSKIADVTRRLNFSKMDSRQLNKTLMGKGVTSDEIADTLGGLSGTVSKQQVLDRIGERGVRTEDVVLGEPLKINDVFKLKFSELNDAGNHQEVRRISDEIYALKSQYDGLLTKPTHYEKWTLPGAKEGSYREMFVTAPLRNYKIPTKEDFLSYYRQQGMGGSPAKEADLEFFYREAIATEQFEKGLLDSIGGTTKVSWRDGHPGYEDIQNPIVRIRFNDRIVDHPEKKQKVLFVEEIQGPQGDQKYVIDGAHKAGTWDTKQEAVDAAKKLRLDPSRVIRVIEGEQGSMPPALQERIYDIGVKRIIAYAKEHGYDGVAWTPGKMQADRYDLAKQIDSLRITKFPSGTYHIGASKGNTPLLVEEGVSESDLPRYIGKELAGKAITQLGSKNTGQVLFEGLDLEIGGEGLKYLYDVRLPSLFKKYGKSEIKSLYLKPTEMTSDDAAKLADIAGVKTSNPIQWWRDLTQEQRDAIRAKDSSRIVPYVPITKDTPSRFPLYSIPPALLTAGFGAKEFGPEYFSSKRAARMRQS